MLHKFDHLLKYNKYNNTVKTWKFYYFNFSNQV